jgi:hypothetical protein
LAFFKHFYTLRALETLIETQRESN